MKELHFIYNMHCEFSVPITEHCFTLKCIPQTDNFQKVTIEKQDIKNADWISSGIDSYGNHYIYGKEKKSHTLFEVNIEGTVCVDREGSQQRKKYHYAASQSTKNTFLDKNMEQYLMKILKKTKTKEIFLKYEENNFQKFLFEVMQEIFAYMEYSPGKTTTSTTAAEAFSLRQGVCQDYAHILIAFYRALHIPAIYIAGYMLGEGASHAWVCAMNPATKKWYEIDPTNNKWVDNDYISVAIGADASDCVMNRGIFYGMTQEKQVITVSVKEEKKYS